MRGGIRAPKILTSWARRKRIQSAAQPAAIPIAKLVASHPVPPIHEVPRAARGAAISKMSLGADRTNYVISESEFPTYVVTGAVPNQPILWSLWRNDALVVEDQEFATYTDREGNWSGRGSSWTADHVGFWRVLAKTGEQQASIRFMVSADLGQPEPVPPSEILGVTHVAGQYRFATPDSDLEPESFLVEGAKHIRNLGAGHVFVYLSPQYRSDYPFDDFDGVAYTSLTSLADSPAYRELFSLPFETVVLTAYTFANWQWIQSRGQADAVPFDGPAERAELADLVRHLATHYPGKTFIVKNWEGDWQIKLSYELDSVASEEQAAEFVEWMRARQDGVRDGRDSSPVQNVKHAIEFNLIHQAQRELRSMLASVIPHVDSDLIAYASWWTLGRGDEVVRHMHDDITFIRNLPGIGNRPIIVTEFGLNYREPDLERRTRDAIIAFSRAAIPLAFYWQIFDNGPDLALVGREATRFASWHTLRSFLGVRNDAAFLPDETMLPERIVAGHQYPAVIAVRNNGQMFDPVVGYALGLLDSQGQLKQIVWVHREVATGEVVTLEFILDAPGTPGMFMFCMFQHGVELFGEEMFIEVQGEAAQGDSRSGA